jgi:tuftelin-interacting protein 11
MKLREVSSLADISMSSWTPSTDPDRIPEVRHNIRLIAESCKSDLDGLAREAKALEDRKKWLIDEDARLRKKVEEEAERESSTHGYSIISEQPSLQSFHVFKKSTWWPMI